MPAGFCCVGVHGEFVAIDFDFLGRPGIFDTNLVNAIRGHTAVGALNAGDRDVEIVVVAFGRDRLFRESILAIGVADVVVLVER